MSLHCMKFQFGCCFKQWASANERVSSHARTSKPGASMSPELSLIFISSFYICVCRRCLCAYVPIIIFHLGWCVTHNDENRFDKTRNEHLIILHTETAYSDFYFIGFHANRLECKRALFLHLSFLLLLFIHFSPFFSLFQSLNGVRVVNHLCFIFDVCN